MPSTFSLNFDYTSPFARNASEHALAARAHFDVRFTAFCLLQSKAVSSGRSLWESPGVERELLALAAGVVVRDRFSEHFPAVHLALFAAHLETGQDVRDDRALRTVLEGAGADADAVRKEIDDGWPYEVIRAEHDEDARLHATFGTPTFVVDGRAAFVRLLTRPQGDEERAVAVIDNVVRMLSAHPEINEFKDTKPYSEVIEAIQSGRMSQQDMRHTMVRLEEAARCSTTEGWRAIGLTQFDRADPLR